MARSNQVSPPQQPEGTVTGGDDSRTQYASQDEDRTARVTDPEVRGNAALAQDQARFDGSLVSEDALHEMLSGSAYERNILPTPPELPGYHLCWLTTTSRYDTLMQRERFGYRPVTKAELGGFDPSMGRDLVQGHEGNVTCNEMVLYKIPMKLYQTIMAHYHHTKPAQHERSMVEGLQAPQGISAQDRTGRQLATMEDGASYLELKQNIERDLSRAPQFA